MAGKLFIKTHGCQMNEYDSSKMADVLAAAEGMTLTEDESEADVILVNTCAIREKAQEKVFSQLGQWKQLKKAKPHLVIGVGGCVASQEGEAIVKRAPFVDLVFGPQTLHRLPEMVQKLRDERRPQVDISFPEIEKFDRMPEPRAEGPTAFVSIMEGCSKYCSFCVVPYTRGEEVSRPFDDVIAEVASLAAQGVREVNLLGQNVNAYRGEMHDGETCDLGLLIQYISEIEGIGRIRFTTSHPVEFNDSLIAAYAQCDKLANYLHLPVQAVGRLEGEEAVGLFRPDDGLVAGAGRCGGVVVLENGWVTRVRLRGAGGSRGENDVVPGGTLELVQPQLGLAPVDAVVAFRVAAKQGMGVRGDLAGRLHGELPGLVVHAEPVAVGENAVVPAAAAFPGSVMDEHDFPGLRVVKPKLRLAGEPLHQEIIDEQLPPRTDGDGGGGRFRSDARDG